MPQHDFKHTELAFLLSLGAMPLACGVGDDDDTTNASTTDATTTSTMGSTGTEGSETNATTDDPTTATTTATTTASTTDESTSGTETDTSADTTTGDLGVCESYGAHAVECGIMYAEYAAMRCHHALGLDARYGDDCVMADSDYYACLAMLDCAALMSETACDAEYDHYLSVCQGGG